MSVIALNSILSSFSIAGPTTRNIGNAVSQQVSAPASTDDAAILEITRQLASPPVTTDATPAASFDSEVAAGLLEVLAAASAVVAQFEEIVSTPTVATMASVESTGHSSDTTINLAGFNALSFKVTGEGATSHLAEIFKAAAQQGRPEGISLTDLLRSSALNTAKVSFDVGDFEGELARASLAQTTLASSVGFQVSQSQSSAASSTFSLTQATQAYTLSSLELVSNALDFKVEA